jgi:two-component system CitB family sensor kinase
VRPRLSLATQILALQVLIVVAMVAVGAAIGLQQTRAQLTRQEAEKVLAVARAVAALPEVQAAFDDADPSAVLQPLAESVRTASDLTFVVIADTGQVRYAHPDPAQIGRRLSTDASEALAGRTVVSTERGTLGRSVRAKVPVRDRSGALVGVVSVGSLEERIAEQWRSTLPGLLLYLLIALLVGAVGSALLARRLRRQTFGLEPGEIGQLLEQREATLHGIREGLVVVDGTGRLTLVNDEAELLLDLPPDSTGRSVADLELPPRLHDVLTGSTAGEDEIVLRAGRVLVLNRKPLDVRGRAIGSVVTLRDRTELEDLTRELGGARSVTDALRAQAHEFSNRMHALAGLLELGEQEQALSFIKRLTVFDDERVARLTEQVREPAVAALLLAKTAYAAEHGVELRLAPDTALPPGTGADTDALVTVVGNLVDNAVEALGTDGGWVQVRLAATVDGVRVDVRDSGPGVAPELAGEVFRHGFTTKIAQSGGQRGLGLALTRQACVTRGGWVDVRNDDGAVFTAFLPYDRAPATGPGAR